MRNLSKHFFALAILVTVPGCSTATIELKPGDDGINQVTAVDLGKKNSQHAAYDAAKVFCLKQHKETVYLKGQTVPAERASASGQERQPGSQIEPKGALVRTANGYLSRVTFKCE